MNYIIIKGGRYKKLVLSRVRFSREERRYEDEDADEGRSEAETG
jgi:hypothetical protein